MHLRKKFNALLEKPKLNKISGSKGFPLFDLIPEIITIVCDHLDGNSLGAFRATCREARNKSQHSFGTRFFHRLVVFPNSHSLNEFALIASKVHLAKYVRKLAINLAHIPGNHLLHLNKAKGYKMIVSSLRTSISMLELLQDICVDVVHHTFEWDAGMLYCGCKTLGNNIPRMQTVRNYSLEQAEKDLLKGTLQIIGETHLNGIRLELLLPEGNVSSVAIKQSWMLTSFTLVFSTGNETWWTNLLHQCMSLKRLTLMGNRSHLPASTTNPIRSMVSHAPPLHWPSLQYLNLVHMRRITQQDLQELLQCHKDTIEGVFFGGCSLVRGDWRPTLSTLQSLPRLQIAKLDHLYSPEPVDGAQKEDFNRFDYPPSKPYAQYRHRVDLVGRDVQIGLEILVHDHQTRMDRTTLDLEEPYVDMRKANAFIRGLIVWDGQPCISTPVDDCFQLEIG
jgi:hypothetical protein